MENHECKENDTCSLGTTTLYKDEENEWWMRVHCGDAVMELNYCPFCGKKLE